MINGLQANYNSRLAKMYILNVSFGIRFVWSIVANFINPITRSKILVFSDGTPEQLRKDIYPSQLLKKYGGEFENPESAWPPTFPPQIYPEDSATHFTVEEFKEEVINNKYAIPSPEIAKSLKGKIKDKRLPEKLYYIKGGINEHRDQFNAIIEMQKTDPSPTLEEKVNEECKSSGQRKESGVHRSASKNEHKVEELDGDRAEDGLDLGESQTEVEQNIITEKSVNRNKEQTLQDGELPAKEKQKLEEAKVGEARVSVVKKSIAQEPETAENTLELITEHAQPKNPFRDVEEIHGEEELYTPDEKDHSKKVEDARTCECQIF